MNERIKLLAKTYLSHERFGPYGESTIEDYYEFYPNELEDFVQLIVRMCADAADMYEGNGYYVGDCVAEYMGYGQEEGVTEWRSK